MVDVIKEIGTINTSEIWSVRLDGMKKFRVLIKYDTIKKPFLNGLDGALNMTGIKYGDFYLGSIGKIPPTTINLTGTLV